MSRRSIGLEPSTTALLTLLVAGKRPDDLVFTATDGLGNFRQEHCGWPSRPPADASTTHRSV